MLKLKINDDAIKGVLKKGCLGGGLLKLFWLLSNNSEEISELLICQNFNNISKKF